MLFLALLALVNAEVHPYRAESAWICNVCQESLEYINAFSPILIQGAPMDPSAKIQSICTTPEDIVFSTACQSFLDRMEDVLTLKSRKKSNTDICIGIKMCEFEEKINRQHRFRVNNKKMIEHINSNQNTWVAAESSRFENATLHDIRILLGTIVDKEHTYKLPVSSEVIKDVPASFDPRTQWPECADVIGHIRDQSACGSCWAFGSTEAYNDRRCIKTKDKTLLSVEDTTACCHGFLRCGGSMGCNGGQPGAAWNWFTRTGVVTGGDYDDMGKTDTCLPYKFPACAHHVTDPKYPACPSKEYSTPSCVSDCSNTGYNTDYSADKKKASSASNFDSVQAIQTSIMQYGPVTGAFTVYSDFPTYKSGVYKHTTGSALGGHAIKIVGWGEEQAVPYWLVANSWNPSWGDGGYFKIVRGQDECGIESEVSAGQA